jgi:hypothetical protein
MLLLQLYKQVAGIGSSPTAPSAIEEFSYHIKKGIPAVSAGSWYVLLAFHECPLKTAHVCSDFQAEL